MTSMAPPLSDMRDADARTGTAAALQSISHYLVATVPTAEVGEKAGAVRERLAVSTFSDASHLFVLRARRLAGAVEIGSLLRAERSQPVDALTSAACPLVPSTIDREHAASIASLRPPS
jgi:Mg/Co/Ni transporter MgtE